MNRGPSQPLLSPDPEPKSAPDDLRHACDPSPSQNVEARDVLKVRRILRH